MQKKCPVSLLGSAGALPAVSPASRDTSVCSLLVANSCGQMFLARRQKLRARRPRSPKPFAIAVLALVAPLLHAQDAVTSPSPPPEPSVVAKPVVVSATRFDIP